MGNLEARWPGGQACIQPIQPKNRFIARQHAADLSISLSQILGAWRKRLWQKRKPSLII